MENGNSSITYFHLSTFGWMRVFLDHSILTRGRMVGDYGSMEVMRNGMMAFIFQAFEPVKRSVHTFINIIECLEKKPPVAIK
jgi:hypothetical protein